MLGLCLLGDDKKKPTTVVSARGMCGGKDMMKEYGPEEDELDMLNPIEIMMEEFIKSVKDGDAKRSADIFCAMMRVERLKSTSIKIEQE